MINMSENAKNVCEICSQEISKDDRASFANGHTSTTDVERVICNECLGNLHGESSKVKFEEVPINLIEFNTDIPKIVEVPCDSSFFYCYQCGYFTTDETTFSEHLKIHQDNHNVVSVADKVLEDTKVPELVQTNTDNCKIIEMPCGYDTVSPTMPSKRFKKHQGNPVKKTSFKCDVFKSFASLTSRLKKDFYCHVCTYSTMHVSSFEQHIRTHPREKPYNCKACDYSSAQLSQVTQHMKTPTGEKPYKCNLCDYSSAKFIQLKDHMYKHTGEKPYKCNLCDYSSVKFIQLKHHVYKHTGVCDYSSSYSPNVKAHMLREHSH